jgi:PPOX class probable F420-dependent enzyme
VNPLPSSNYVSLTTFRRTGVPVSTPVWAAPDGDTLVVWTRTDSGNRRTPCPPPLASSRRDPAEGHGGPAVEGVADFVARTEWPAALAALRRAYGVRFQLGYVTSRVVQRLSRRDSDRNEIIRIRPA